VVDGPKAAHAISETTSSSVVSSEHSSDGLSEDADEHSTVVSDQQLSKRSFHSPAATMVLTPSAPCVEDFVLAYFLQHHWCAPSLSTAMTVTNLCPQPYSWLP